MPINYGILQNIQPSQVIAQLPSSSGGGDGGDDIMGGLMSLIKGVSGMGAQNAPQSSNVAPQSFQNPHTYGTQGPARSFGTSSFNQQSAPIGSTTLGAWNNNHPSMPQQQLPSHLQNVVQQSSVWDNATKQMGLKEGSPALTQYLAKANPKLDPSVTPWCAGYVNSVLGASGFKGTNSLAAKSFLNYGTPIQKPTQGDIVVLNRGNDPKLGHVGFVQSVDYNKGVVNILGGNQDNSVSIKPFPISAVAGFRRPPSGQEVQQFAQQNNISDPNQLPAFAQKLAQTQPVQQNAVQQTNEIDHVMNGIAGVESGGEKNPYMTLSKPSRNGDRAYGKYQIMGNNIPSWSKEALGHPVTPQQFLNDPDIQEKVARFHIEKNLKQYGPEDAASIWFSGRPKSKAGNSKDVYGTTVPAYIKKFNQHYLKSKSGSSSAMLKTSMNGTYGQLGGDNANQDIQNPVFQGDFSGGQMLYPENTQYAPLTPINPPEQAQPMPTAPNYPSDMNTPHSQMAQNGVNWGLLQQLLQQRGMA